VIEVFDRQAEDYDTWYETPAGRAVLTEELAALQPLVAPLAHPWLEVGVGTGRFAAGLGAEFGIDPAQLALSFAARRGVLTAAARGEALPFRSHTFGAVLIIATLCFVSDPLTVLLEARRVLRPGGRVVLGVVPADGPWGKRYQVLAANGDPYYQHARFFSRQELRSLLYRAELRIVERRGALLWPPESDAPPPARVVERDQQNAGFLALLVAPERRSARDSNPLTSPKGRFACRAGTGAFHSATSDAMPAGLSRPYGRCLATTCS
jgi:SAM-dependent methyltransferase